MESSRKVSPGLVITLVLLVSVIVIFVIAFVIASEGMNADPLAGDADDIEAQVAALLANADAARGAELVVTHQCVNCHVYAAGLSAPSWRALADRAGQREPSLSPAAYLYESIMQPTEFIVEGYAPSMPQNFKDVLNPEEIGDIVAYLLTLHAGN